MRKDDLVRSVIRAARAKVRSSSATIRCKSERRPAKKTAARASRPSAKVAVKATGGEGASGRRKLRPKSPQVIARIQKASEERARQKDLASMVKDGNGANGKSNPKAGGGGARAKTRKDRIVLLVRDAYWLQAVWELTRQSVDRAQAAMAAQWHTARPVLRLLEVDGGATTSTAERVVREIGIHGGVSTWYIDLQGPPRCYRADIGYLAANGRFFSLARSNAVTPPRPSNGDRAEENWSDLADDCEKIYALSGGYSDDVGRSDVQSLFEERLGRPVGSQAGLRYGVGADRMLSRRRDFLFEVDAEIIVFGATRPNARVTLAGAPVKLRPDGTFSARLALPDRRQVLPVVASSADGIEQRTVVLAVERNTKVMEPMIRETPE